MRTCPQCDGSGSYVEGFQAPQKCPLCNGFRVVSPETRRKFKLAQAEHAAGRLESEIVALEASLERKRDTLKRTRIEIVGLRKLANPTKG